MRRVGGGEDFDFGDLVGLGGMGVKEGDEGIVVGGWRCLGWVDGGGCRSGGRHLDGEGVC